MPDILKTENNVVVHYRDLADGSFAKSVSIAAGAFTGTGDAVILAVGTTSNRVDIPNAAVNTGVRVVNIGTNAVWIEFGTTSALPTATIPTSGVSGSIPILPNTSESFSIIPGQSVIAAISNSAGNTLYISSGEGL